MSSILTLQRTIGNQATQRLLEANMEDVQGDDSTTTQTARFGHDFSQIPVVLPGWQVPHILQLVFNTPDDRYEREADRIANAVMRMPFVPLSQAPAARQAPTISPLRADAAGIAPPFPTAATAIDRMQSSGLPLPEAERAFFEHGLGADLSHVRLHTDANAVTANRALRARAFTVGNNIAFEEGAYRPGTPAGRQLMAHELTHVVQQNGIARRVQRQAIAGINDEFGSNPFLDWLIGLAEEYSRQLLNTIIQEGPKLAINILKGLLASVTEQMISSDDLQTIAFGLFLEFMFGVGSSDRSFGDDSVVAKAMKDSPGVNQARDYFYSTRTKEYKLNMNHPGTLAAKPLTEYRAGFNPIVGPIRAGSDWMEQFIGNFKVEIFPNESGTEMRIECTNPTSVKSFLYHLPFVESYERSGGVLPTPMGTIRQTIYWTEPIVNMEFERKIKKMETAKREKEKGEK